MPRLTRRLLVAGSSSLVAARAGAAGKAATAAPPAPVIGALLPLSGDLSLAGDECLRGIRLAAAAMDAGGGIAGAPVALIPGDNGGPATVAQAAAALLAGDHAGVLLGSGDSALSYPGSAAAELAQIPYIELNAAADGIMNRGFKFLLRTGPTTTMIAAVAIAVLGRHFTGKKIGLLFNTGATAGAIAAALLAALGAAAAPLLTVGYPADSADLQEPVSRLKRAGAEVILHAGDAPDVLFADLAMRNLGWRPPVIGCGDGFLLRETAYALGPGFAGTIVVGAPFYTPRAGYIADAYLARYGMPPRSPDSLTAYVGAKLVFDTLNAVGGDPARLLDKLRRTRIPPGTLANGWGVAFDKTGQNTASSAVAQRWLAGTLVPLAGPAGP